MRASLNRLVVTASMTALAVFLGGSSALAQSRGEPQVETNTEVQTAMDLAATGPWLQRLVGRFSIEGFVENLNRPCGTSPEEPFCSGVTGAMDCISIGNAAGVQCILNAVWEEKWDIDPGRNPMVMEVMGFAPYLNPAMAVYGLDPRDGGVRYLLVNNKGHAEFAQGSVHGDRATFTATCVNKAAILGTSRGDCRRVTRIHALADARIAEMMIDIEVLVKAQWLVATNIVLTLRRVSREEDAPQARDLNSRLDEVTSFDEEIEEEESEAGEEGTDADVAGTTQIVDPPVRSAAALPASSKSLLKLDALDEVVAESARERQRQASPAGRVSGPDVVTVTLDDTIRMRLQTRIPQSEIRFQRQSLARQPVEGTRPPLQMQADRLMSASAQLFRTAILEFAAGVNEADGLPALLPFGAGTSLFNLDYVRLRDTMQPTLINLRNAVDPETRRCTSQLGLGDDRGDYPYRFVLLGDKLGDCNRAVRSREGDLIFADSVPEPLRQELREFYAPIYNRFARELGSEPGIIFVAWRPESSRSDFRFERSLNRTNLLLFNGAAWEKGFTAEQRNALWEDFALDQVVRRVRWQGEPDSITESAVTYLLELARSARQQTTNRVLSAKLPDWIAACARSLSARTGTAPVLRGIINHDCGMVVHFVYDAVIRSKSSGADTVHRTWNTLLADSFRRGQSGVPTNVFIDSTPDARRIIQGLMDGAMDWNGFAADMSKLGVQLRIARGQIAPAVQVLSLTHFRD